MKECLQSLKTKTWCHNCMFVIYPIVVDIFCPNYGTEVWYNCETIMLEPLMIVAWGFSRSSLTNHFCVVTNMKWNIHLNEKRLQNVCTVIPLKELYLVVFTLRWIVPVGNCWTIDYGNPWYYLCYVYGNLHVRLCVVKEPVPLWKKRLQ